MCRDDVEDWLRRTVLDLQDGLTREQVVASASFFQDLGFDSLAFEKLVATIEAAALDHALNRDLSHWYFRAARHGEDTFGSLVDFLINETAS